MAGFKKKADILIAGAGIAGCAAAQELQSKGIEYLLVEKHVDPGGLTRSISIGDAHFDYTGHFLHLVKCKSPAALPYANQSDDEWMLLQRKSFVYLQGQMIPSPLQYNLYYIPEEARKRCIEGFRNRPQIANIRSFKEYLLAGFGQGICDYFLFPYNEKILACDLEDLSVNCVKRFFPVPDKDMIERGYETAGVNLHTGYNTHFWYPKRHGIGLLAQGMAKNLNAMLTCCPIERIDLATQCAYTLRGEIHYERMLTCLPLKQFCTLCADSSLNTLAAALRHTRVLCLNILLRGSVPEYFADCHWIYVPQKTIPFYRVGIYSHISPQMNPSDTVALYVEVAFSDNAPLPIMNVLLDKIFQSLENLGWARHSDCILLSANWIDCAYVLFDHYRKRCVNRILEILRQNHIYPIGRYGLWDYMSMEDSILSGIQTARGLIKC